MTGSLVLPNHQSTELAEYKSATGLIRRGLDDLSRALRPRPNTLRVPTDYTTLQQAVDFASEGDIIEILPGEYEENVGITKGLTIRAHSGPVQLRTRHRAQPLPLLLVDLKHGRLTIENIAFEGNSGALLWPQTAVQIRSGRVILNSCQFSGWRTYDGSSFENDDYKEWYWSDGGYEGGSPAIVVFGPTSFLEVRDCQLASCDAGIDVNEGARAIISECDFFYVDNPIGVDDGAIASSRNCMVGGSCFVAVGENANIYSQYDSLTHTSCLLDGSEALCSIVTFVHATVCSHSLLGISIGESLVHPDFEGEWAWAAPKVFVADSIVYLESTECFDIRFANSALPERDVSQLDVWDHVEFGGRNLIHALPDFPGDDPKFGDSDRGRLSLKADSPAIGAASDGTNLGAWQGNVQ